MTRYTPNWIQQGNYAAVNDRRVLGAIWPNEAVSGMVATAGAGMTVNIAQGAAVVSLGAFHSMLCSSNAQEAVVIPAAPTGGNNRIDLIVAQVRSNELDAGANNDWIFQVVTGTPAASPVAPAEPARSVSIAQVYVASGAVSITGANITDVRPRRLDQPWNCAWGLLSPTTGLTIGPMAGPITAETAITNAIATLAVPAGRVIRTTIRCGTQSTVAGDVSVVRIKDTGTQLAIVRQIASAANVNYPVIAQYTEAIATGQTLTRSATIARDSGSGNLSIPASANAYTQFLIEDLGPIPGSAGTMLEQLEPETRPEGITP